MAIQIRREQAFGTGHALASRVHWAREWGPFALLLAAIALLNYYTLLSVPAPFADEGWNANRAWGLLQTGHPFGTMDAGVFDRFGGYWCYFPWLGTGLHALAIRLLGPSLFSVRAVSLIFGLILLGAVYAIGRGLYGCRMGLLAVGLVALTPAFLGASHLARHDIVVAAFGFLAVALHVTGHRSHLPVNGALSGLIAAATLDIHAIGLLYVAAVAALHLLDHGWDVLRARDFRSFCLGAAVGFAFFAAMHLLPNLQTYATLAGLGFGSARTPPLLVPDPNLWLGSVIDAGALLLESCHLLAILLLAALVGLPLGGSASDARVMALFASLVVGLVALVRFKAGMYGILVAPAACLLIAAFLDRLLVDWARVRERAGLRTKLAFALVVAALSLPLLGTLQHSLTYLLQDSREEYRTTLEQLQQAVPPADTIIGPQTYWFGLTDQKYLSWEQLTYYRRYAPDSTLEDAFQALGPHFLIVDRHMEQFITDEPAQLPEQFRYLYVPRTDLERFLSGRGHLVAAMKTAAFGTVRVYRLDLAGSRAAGAGKDPA